MPANTTTGNRRSPAELKSFLAPYSPAVRTLILQIRARVFQVVPEALEQIDLPAKLLAYGYASTYQNTICVIMPQRAYVNLGLPRGAELADPARLLTGTGKRARHIKITAPEQLEGAPLRALLIASAAQARTK